MPKPKAALIALLLQDRERMAWMTVHADTSDAAILAWATEMMIDAEVDETNVATWEINLRWSTDHAINHALEWSEDFPHHSDRDDMRLPDPDDMDVLSREASLIAALDDAQEDIVATVVRRAAADAALEASNLSCHNSHEADLQRQRDEEERIRDIL